MIRVFIVDDHALVREGVKRFLGAEPGLVVVGEAASGEEALQRAQDEAFDVMLLDLNLPGLSGLEVLRRVRVLRPRLRVVVLTMQDEDQHAIRVLRAGADGYVTKGSPPERLIEAIRTVSAGDPYLPARLARILLTPDGAADSPLERLSDRERQVLTALGRGGSPGAIARELGVSASTVSTHLGRIKRKLGKRTVPELVRYAIEAGLA